MTPSYFMKDFLIYIRNWTNCPKEKLSLYSKYILSDFRFVCLIFIYLDKHVNSVIMWRSLNTISLLFFISVYNIRYDKTCRNKYCLNLRKIFILTFTPIYLIPFNNPSICVVNKWFLRTQLTERKKK